MNILQIQDQLKGLPDQALTGYVQNPTGQVPTYLALSELQRRKTMRDKYQQQQAPQSTVAEDMAQEAQPQMMAPQEAPVQEQGVASLPTGEMYDEKNYATGGIVAFDDGGSVKHFDQGGTSRLGDWFSGLKAQNADKEAINKQINDLLTEKYRIQSDIFSARTPEQKAAQDQALVQIESMLTEARAKKEAGSTATVTPPAVPAPTSTTGGPREADTKLPSSFTGIDQPSQFNISPTALNTMSTSSAAKADTAPGTVSREGIGSLYKPAEDRSADYDALQQDELGAAEAAAAKYRALLGDDPMRPKLEEKLTKLEERTKKQEEQAPWMALARAGLGMAAGKSQHALQNIAEGATMGFEDYRKAQDRLETLHDKQFDIQNKLAQAKRAEDIAAATHGLKSEETIKAQNHSDKLAKLSYKTSLDLNNQKNKIDAYQAITQNKMADITGEHYRNADKASLLNAMNRTNSSGLDEDTIRKSYDKYLEGQFMDLPPGLTYDQFKYSTQGLSGVGLSAKAQSAYDKYKP